MADFDEEAFSADDSRRLWAEVGECLSTECQSHESIDDALREWLDLTTRICHGSPDAQDDVTSCAHMLLESQLFDANKDYIRTQIIHSLLQEDDAGPLHAIACLLFLDGRHDESAFPRMVDEACFSRLLELINAHRADNDPRLHRLLLQLMYEMSRIERLKVDDLMLVDDGFIHHLFGAIEGMSDDVQDPYHYPTIRVLLVLNEQYMLASTDSAADDGPRPAQLTNRIVKCLSLHGPLFRTFGENIILLLNRETETSLQLLILKLLYLLFTTKTTYEYFYTNDLQVLLDVIIRNLMDLPDEKMSLRHTYLRVMYPLLAHTQLNQSPHYKRDEVLRVLRILRGSHNAHFAPADETTLRLVDRVAKVQWLAGESSEDKESSGQAECASSVSVGDVAGVRERPGVQTPSRHGGDSGAKDAVDTPSQEEVVAAVKTKKPLPAVPRHRHGTRVTQPPTERHVNGSGKKIPPKAPPPRRIGRVKTIDQPPPGPTMPE
ncbi:LDB17 protein [Hirsutella rhossiliensis]|uniref:LDB17 protein n=1 Tax=Hirsutella rhossiliensis TaxID=111463 RepID=A0A9P8MP67_9HYPO|nr:LDB17 protein [Hirsutella rhossiliensis]KAH0957989.1 LDB17 protein [Hirsutella rhossiliensis]